MADQTLAGKEVDLKSKAALRLAREWIDLNSERLEVDWRLAREGKPLEKVPPLD